MASLTTETQTEPAEKQCAICYSDLDLKNTVITPCNHAYCNGCFFKWLSRKETCALCRAPLLSNALVDERLEELQDVQGELMESYRAHRVIKRDLKRKRRRMRNLTDDTNALLARQIRLRVLLDETKMACEHAVRQNDIVKDALKTQRYALDMLKDYKKEWNELHTPLHQEEKRGEEKHSSTEEDINVPTMTHTIEELASTERRRALRQLSRMRRRAAQAAADIPSDTDEEEQDAPTEGEVTQTVIMELTPEEIEEETDEEEETEEAEEAEEEAEEHEYDTGDEFELRITGTAIAPLNPTVTPPRRRMVHIPGAPTREAALPSSSMFIFGANRNSPDTITHSVTSPFEMPTMFDNSTSTIPLDFNPHINLFTQSLQNQSDMREFLTQLNMEQPRAPTIGRRPRRLVGEENSWPLSPGHRAMRRLFNSSPQTTEEAVPPEEISND